jgi:hypothetical protein
MGGAAGERAGSCPMLWYSGLAVQVTHAYIRRMGVSPRERPHVQGVHSGTRGAL